MTARVLVLAALLALFAVLVEWRLLDRPEPTAPQQQARPGYYLEGVALEEFGNDGKLQVGLRSDRAVENPDNGVVTLTTVAVDYHAPEGRQWQLTALTGRVPPDSGIIEFEGDVMLSGLPEEGPDLPQLRTARLTLDTANEHAQTRDPVELVFGPHHLRALGMRADLKAGNLRLESGVNGEFTP